MSRMSMISFVSALLLVFLLNVFQPLKAMEKQAAQTSASTLTATAVSTNTTTVVSTTTATITQTTTPAVVDSRPDAPTYGKRGPYPVGVQSFEMKGIDGPSVVTVWYPALNPKGVAEEVTYLTTFPNMPSQNVYGHALQNAAPDVSKKPYPLFVFAHGAFMYSHAHVNFTEHLASYGFVVMSTDFRDNWGTSGKAPMYPSLYSRPKTVSQEIDLAQSLSAPGGALAGMVDMKQIAVGGHSLGGYTALAVGGGLLDIADFRVWCEGAKESGVFKTCPGVLKNEQKLATVAGLTTPPEHLWPSFGDPRVGAIIMMAPGARYIGPHGAANVKIPAMLLGGSADWVLDPEVDFYPVYESLGSKRKSLVVFEGASHEIFTNTCEAAGWSGPDAESYWTCSDGVWDMQRAHDLTNHFVTAFLLSVFKQDADATAALTPENASFIGIRYETTGQ